MSVFGFLAAGLTLLISLGDVYFIKYSNSLEFFIALIGVLSHPYTTLNFLSV